jgi:hypothetical protein
MNSVSTPWVNSQPDLEFYPETSSLYSQNKWTSSSQWAPYFATPTPHTYHTIPNNPKLNNRLSLTQHQTPIRNSYENSLPLSNTCLRRRTYAGDATGTNNMTDMATADAIMPTTYSPSTLLPSAISSAQSKNVAAAFSLQTQHDVEQTMNGLNGSLYSSEHEKANYSSQLTPSSITQESSPTETRRKSLHKMPQADQARTRNNKTGRRRSSECVEPGSARSIYLDKNRKAASKCRGKQKKEQEELVETARSVELRNRMLKLEVNMLRSSMQELMDSVAEHVDCPNSRLETYLQRGANRIAYGMDSWPNLDTNNTSSSSRSTKSISSSQNEREGQN